MTLAAAPVYNGGTDPVVAICPSSSSPDVTGAGDYTFRVCPSDLAHGTALAHWVRDRLGTSRAAPCSTSTIEYGRGIRQTFVAEFTRLGGELEAVDPYLGERPDVGPYLDRLARRPDARVSSWWPATGARRKRSSARPGSADSPCRCSAATASRASRQAGALAEGVYLSSLLLPVDSRARPTGGSSRRSAASIPDAGTPNQPAAATYDAIYLLRDVIARAGTEPRGRSAALAGVGSVTPPFEGVTGTVAFDANGDVPNQNVYIGLVQRGAVEVVNGADALAEARNERCCAASATASSPAWCS